MEKAAHQEFLATFVLSLTADNVLLDLRDNFTLFVLSS